MIEVDISPTGTAILEGYGAGVMYIEDAIERILDEIEYFNKRIADTELGHEELWKQALEDPTAMDYETYHTELERNRQHYKKTKAILQQDLETLYGAEVPF